MPAFSQTAFTSAISAISAVLWLSAGQRGLALENGLDRTPPMGFNTWESWGCDVTQDMVRAATDAMVSKGLKAVGYDIVGIDDCWVDAKRNATGYLQASSNFSDGMAALGKYIHEKGLKYGLYQSSGTMTCQQRAGSLGYEWRDAQTFASWGVDFLKYDDCFHELYSQVEKDAPNRFPFDAPPILRYPLMGMALNKTGRNISYMCNFPWQLWGLKQDPSMGGDWTGEFCNSWRTCGDPQPGFDSALGYIDCAEKWADYIPSGPGRWNNLAAIEIGNGDMTRDQQRAIFSLYSLIKTPLFIGADVTKLDGDALATYTNKEVISINQDPLGSPGRQIRAASDKAGELWAGELEGGEYALVMVNRDGSPRNISVSWADDLGVSSQAFKVRDLWEQKDVASKAESGFSARVSAQAVVAIRLTPVA